MRKKYQQRYKLRCIQNVDSSRLRSLGRTVALVEISMTAAKAKKLEQVDVSG